jgi:hypothetical protein
MTSRGEEAIDVPKKKTRKRQWHNVIRSSEREKIGPIVAVKGM